MVLGFTLADLFTQLNAFVAEVMPVVYVVGGISVGAYALRRVRGLLR
jgi:hypothetical protein